MSYNPTELRKILAEMGESAYRGAQLFEWLNRGVSYEDMRNMPHALLERLAAKGPAQSARVDGKRLSADGETIKYLFALQDGNIVEGIFLRYRHGNTLCVSSQVGCRMGCHFCASTMDGRVRNLTAGEMLSQAALVNSFHTSGKQRGITNIVLMGSGEPLDNYDACVRFIKLTAEPTGMGISPRNVSLSTCGLVEGINHLAEENLPVTLSLSLHAADDDTRRQIMPIANRYTISETLNACRKYVEKTGRRLAVEYTLIQGINDTLNDARQLARLLDGIRAHVNIIPLNAVEGLSLKPPSPHATASFEKELTRLGVSASRRRTLGEDIEGACGQLRRKYIQDIAGETANIKNGDK